MTAVSIPRPQSGRHPGFHLTLGRLLRQAGAWWVGELAGLLPRTAFAWLPGGGGPQAVLEFSVQGARLVVRAAPGQARGRGPVVIPLGDGDGPEAARVRRQYAGLPVPIHLDAAAVFETTVDLPLAAERSLEPILRHQLERLVPLDPATLRFGWRVIDRLPARNVVRVRIAIAKQATLDRATSLAAQVGLVPRSIICGAEDDAKGGGEGERFVLWQAHAGASVGAGQRRLRRGIECLAALLAVAAYALHVEQLDATRAALRDAVEQARRQAAIVQTLGQQAEQASRSLAFFADKRAAPTPLAVLDALTGLIPRDSWIDEFHLHGMEIELIGYAPRATDVVARIENADLFRDAAFRSPVTLAPDGRSERFELGFRTRPASP